MKERRTGSVGGWSYDISISSIPSALAEFPYLGQTLMNVDGCIHYCIHQEGRKLKFLSGFHDLLKVIDRIKRGSLPNNRHNQVKESKHLEVVFSLFFTLHIVSNIFSPYCSLSKGPGPDKYNPGIGAR